MRTKCRVSVVLLLGLIMSAGALLAEVPAEIAAQKAAWQEQIVERQMKLEDEAERLQLATAIMDEKEALSGDREFDAAWKAQRVRDLSKQTQEELQTMLGDVEAGRAADLSKVLGTSNTDLVFTPLPAACRFYDSRTDSIPGPFFNGASFDFRVAGTFFGQGFSTDCGVPFGPAVAVTVNVLAVDTGGKGNWQVWRFGSGMPGDSVINFAANAALDINLINGVMIPICDPMTQPSCPDDLSAHLNFAAFSDFVMNVTGYFSRVATEEVKVVTARAVTGATTGLPASPGCVNYLRDHISVPSTGTIVINANVWLRFSHTAGISDYALVKIAHTQTDCTVSPGNTMAAEVSAGVGTDDTVYVTVPVLEVFSVFPGIHHYYLNGYMAIGASPGDSFWYADITAQFFPD